MKQFLYYTRHLESLAQTIDQSADWHRKATAALDGEPGRELSRSAPLRHRRRDGAFFTGSRLAHDAINTISSSPLTKFLDPTCGAGDLLLAAARQLPVKETLRETLSSWDKFLAGEDLHSAFVRAAKARLAILALQRGARPEPGKPLDLNETFARIRVGDATESEAGYTHADWILVNPPYGYKTAPRDCKWAKGKVTAAALFFEICLERAKEGARITAILPEVLRSGSRYRAWRQFVESVCIPHRIKSQGLFDEIADIDVFVLDVTKKAPETDATTWNWTGMMAAKVNVGGYFEVHVGAVVPHRHRRVGQEVPYIHARAMPAWQSVTTISETRKFNGTLFQPPFVVLRRTSRPQDLNRAIATLIMDPRPTAVENHLVVCSPRSGGLSDCRELVELLQRPQTNSWLNERIRCRHLTVAAIRELPWWDSK